MKFSDFRDLDFRNAGGWAPGVKYVFCGLLFALILLLGWWLIVRDQQDDLESRQKQEAQLKLEFHDKQGKVANLAALKQQLDDMRDILRQLLRQLPSKTEMPALLVDISQTALSAGLETQLFQPGAETIKEGFYAEKPIALRMLGTYHQFGTFISGVAALPRVVILTMHNVALKPVARSDGTSSGQLMLEGTVKTYRYVEEDEAESAAAAKKGAAPKTPPKPAGKAGGKGDV
jgi:type IV pilus assembly protein PilO